VRGPVHYVTRVRAILHGVECKVRGRESSVRAFRTLEQVGTNNKHSVLPASRSEPLEIDILKQILPECAAVCITSRNCVMFEIFRLLYEPFLMMPFNLCGNVTSLIHVCMYVVFHLLTSWSKVRLEKLTVPHLVNKFLAFYGI
jgi:hypothetical protein